MIKAFIVTTVIVCVAIIGCQVTGVSQDELAELKKELKQTQEYISELKAHYDTMIDKAYSLIKLEMGKTTKEMEEIWMSVEKDTTPGPKPPPPPLGAAREIR